MYNARIWAIWRCEAKKGEVRNFFNVHEGDRQNVQPGAKCGYFYFFNAKGRIFYLFQVGVLKMTSSHDFS